MTISRKKMIMKHVDLVRHDLAERDYVGALSASQTLTIVGFGLPFMTAGYWHAKHLQHSLYYYQAGYNSLGKVRQELNWIAEQVKRTEVTAE